MVDCLETSNEEAWEVWYHCCYEHGHLVSQTPSLKYSSSNFLTRVSSAAVAAFIKTSKLKNVAAITDFTCMTSPSWETYLEYSNWPNQTTAVQFSSGPPPKQASQSSHPPSPLSESYSSACAHQTTLQILDETSMHLGRTKVPFAVSIAMNLVPGLVPTGRTCIVWVTIRSRWMSVMMIRVIRVFWVCRGLGRRRRWLLLMRLLRGSPWLVGWMWQGGRRIRDEVLVHRCRNKELKGVNLGFFFKFVDVNR